MAEREKRYDNDIIVALAKHTIPRLWIIIILLIVLLFGTNAAWIYYESSFAEEVVTVEQESETGYNNYVGNDGFIVN